MIKYKISSRLHFLDKIFNSEGQNYLFFSLLGNCRQNPCKNSGTCAVKGDDIECHCKGGFTGDLCEKGKDILKIILNINFSKYARQICSALQRVTVTKFVEPL